MARWGEGQAGRLSRTGRFALRCMTARSRIMLATTIRRRSMRCWARTDGVRYIRNTPSITVRARPISFTRSPSRRVVMCAPLGYEELCTHRPWRGLAERIAALAIQQSRGDLIEAVFLIRAYRTTLPRLAGSAPVDPRHRRVVHRRGRTGRARRPRRGGHRRPRLPREGRPRRRPSNDR